MKINLRVDGAAVVILREMDVCVWKPKVVFTVEYLIQWRHYQFIFQKFIILQAVCKANF